MKVGDYVRTKWGCICKIVNVNDFREPSMKYGVDASYLKDFMFIGDEDIIKSSPNIIDLIEVGDYVNEIKVDFVFPPLKVFLDGEEYLEDEIKSIVTKEQFEAMQYKVGE